MDFHENGTNSSSSSKKLDQIQQLKEKNESLERTLILKLNEIKIANDAAQEYENELNDLRHEFAEQSKQLKEANVKNVELSAELRIKKDDIDQLNFDVRYLYNLLISYYLVSKAKTCRRCSKNIAERKGEVVYYKG